MADGIFSSQYRRISPFEDVTGIFANPPGQFKVNPVQNPPVVPPAPIITGTYGDTSAPKAPRQIPGLSTIPPKPPAAPNYPALEELKGILRSQPKREEHQLGKWGKALAGVAGVAEGYNRGVQPGIETGLGLMDRPYARALEDWKTKAGGAGELANIEVKLDELKAKRESEFYDQWYKTNKNAMDAAEAYSKLGLNEAQIANYENLRLTRGVSPHFVDGKVVWTDAKGRDIEVGPIVGETPPERRKAELEDRLAIYEAEQAGRVSLENIRHLNDVFLTRMRGDQEENIVRLRAKLEAGMMGTASPQELRTAFDSAVEQVHQQYPALVNGLFKPDGTLITDKEGKPNNPALFDMYQQVIEQRRNENLSGGPGVSSATVPSDARSHAVDKETTDAQEYLKRAYPNTPELLTNAEALERTKKYLKENPQALQQAPQAPIQTTVPQVPPPVGPIISPTVPAVPPAINLPPQGLFRQQVPQVPPGLMPGGQQGLTQAQQNMLRMRTALGGIGNQPSFVDRGYPPTNQERRIFGRQR